MSQSQQFANYSNSAQALKSNIDQLGSTEQQTTDDAKQFEAEYLTGIAVAAKTKLADQLVGLLKKSKGVKKATAVVEDAKKTANQKINGLADDLTSKIPKLDTTPPITNPSADSDAVTQLKGIAKDAAEKSTNTSSALESAQNEVIDARDAVRVAGETRDAAQTVSTVKDAQLVAKAGGQISVGEQQAATQARLDLNTARSGVDSATARSDAAERNVQELAQQSEAHAAEAERAGQDLKNALATGDVELGETANVARKAKRLAKEAKDAKDIEEGGEAGDEDPVGLIVSAVAAIASTWIGRKIAVHSNQITSSLPKGATLNYGSTLGA